MGKIRICSSLGCNNRHKAKGLCKSHWGQMNHLMMKERNNHKCREYVKKNQKTVRFLIAQRKYKESYKGIIFYRSAAAKRRAAKLNRTPKWADIPRIKRIYENCPMGMTVDHIVPLQGKNVSGLHVLWNLQYLTKEENSSKGNRT